MGGFRCMCGTEVLWDTLRNFGVALLLLLQPPAYFPLAQEWHKLESTPKPLEVKRRPKQHQCPEAKGQLVICHDPDLSMRSIRRIRPYISVNLDLLHGVTSQGHRWAVALLQYVRKPITTECYKGFVWYGAIWSTFVLPSFFRPSNLQVLNLQYWDPTPHDIPWPTLNSKSLRSLQEGSQTQNTWEIQVFEPGVQPIHEY